jgi:hypothetical protein
MVVVQLRHDTEGRAYYRRKRAAGKTSMEAMRALKRRLSDVVYGQLVADQRRGRDTGQPEQASPGGQAGGGYWLQRGRLEPQRRRFGEVTSRTRQHRPYPGHGNGRRPFFEAFPTPSNNAGPQPASSALCLTPARTGAHSQAGTTTPP